MHRHMDLVLGNSRAVVRELVTKEGCSENRVRLIYLDLQRGNSAALGAAIVQLAHDPDLRRSMGERAKKRAANEFSCTMSLNQYCALYEELLAQKDGKRRGRGTCQQSW